jgi:superfamily II DNA or RNA helicase
MLNMDIREKRQLEAINSFNKKGLIKAAPRFGKIKTSIGIMEREKPQRILISYPRTDIKEGWLNDFEKWGFDADISFQTFKSIKKEAANEWDMFVIDEIHEASVNQLKEINTLVKKTPLVLALSGTVTNKTQREIEYHTGIRPCYSYSIEEAVEEGILCDYQILLHKVPLDNKKLLYGSKTEKRKFKDYGFVKTKLEKEYKPTFFLDLKQIQIIQNSYSKLEKTKELLQQFKEERILVFCGTTEIADNLGIPVYHSKSKERELFINFCNGEGNHLATINMMQAGVTIAPINKGIMNYTSGSPESFGQRACRFLGFEYNTPDKKAEIHIITTDEEFELERLKTAMSFFDPSKIHYVKH